MVVPTLIARHSKTSGGRNVTLATPYDFSQLDQAGVKDEDIKPYRDIISHVGSIKAVKTTSYSKGVLTLHLKRGRVWGAQLRSEVEHAFSRALHAEWVLITEFK